MDEWIPVQGGSGAINIQVSFKPAQVSLTASGAFRADRQAPLTIDSFELLKVIGKGSFGKVSRFILLDDQC